MLLVLLSTEEIPSDVSDSDVCGLPDTVPGKTFCCCIVYVSFFNAVSTKNKIFRLYLVSFEKTKPQIFKADKKQNSLHGLMGQLRKYLFIIWLNKPIKV